MKKYIKYIFIAIISLSALSVYDLYRSNSYIKQNQVYRSFVIKLKLGSKKYWNIESQNQYLIALEKELELCKKNNIKLVCCWGNSLTAGGGGEGITYPDILQQRLGDKYKVINCGVGGENTSTITARQGGIPMYIDIEINIPDSKENEVIIGDLDNSHLRSSFNHSMVKPLLQTGSYYTINPILIDTVKCTLWWNGWDYKDNKGKYIIKRIHNGNPIKIKSGTLIHTASELRFKDSFVNIFFIGQNGGFKSANDLLCQYQKMIDFSNSDRFIIIGLYAKGTIQEMKEMEALFKTEFGDKYINLREYLSEKALKDANIKPKEEDMKSVSVGLCPPSIMSDKVHLNKIGYELLGNLVYERMHILGY